MVSPDTMDARTDTSCGLSPCALALALRSSVQKESLACFCFASTSSIVAVHHISYVSGMKREKTFWGVYPYFLSKSLSDNALMTSKESIISWLLIFEASWEFCRMVPERTSLAGVCQQLLSILAT